MKKITEEFIHFLWKNQSLTGISLSNDDSTEIEILDPGDYNKDAGPDFFNAKIRIDGTTWAGNVEIHINASDWLKHKHHLDHAYDSVILHVVCYKDCIITRRNNIPVPTCILRFPSILWKKYEFLMMQNYSIPCGNNLSEVNPVHRVQWTSRLLVEKLSGKQSDLKTSFEELSSHLEGLFNQVIFRCFGMPVNTLPFEMLASRIPFNKILRLKDDLHQLEALLFGASGMLDNLLPNDIYMEGLKNEYARHRLKLGGEMMPVSIWKFMRMRPSSFPTIRIAQLSALINTSYPLTEKLRLFPNLYNLEKIFRVRASDYWNTHYLFGKVSEFRIKYTGKDFLNRLVINGIVPFMFFLGKAENKQEYCEYSISLLEQLPAENNVILKNWSNFGIKADSAFDSQGLIFLYKDYCKLKRCLDCQFGNYLLLHGKKT